jgi:hypothetical protein
MKSLEIILFQAGICDTCDVTWAILQSFVGVINGYLGEDIVTLKQYSLADEEGKKAALQMGVTMGPTFFVDGEKHEGRIPGDEIFELIASKLDIDRNKMDALRKAFLGG